MSQVTAAVKLSWGQLDMKPTGQEMILQILCRQSAVLGEGDVDLGL